MFPEILKWELGQSVDRRGWNLLKINFLSITYYSSFAFVTKYYKLDFLSIHMYSLVYGLGGLKRRSTWAKHSAIHFYVKLLLWTICRHKILKIEPFHYVKAYFLLERLYGRESTKLAYPNNLRSRFYYSMIFVEKYWKLKSFSMYILFQSKALCGEWL